MRRGVWHQFGSQSQTLARDVIENGVGVGVVISPRDLQRATAIERAAEFVDLGADVLLDTQFHVPEYSNSRLGTYGLESFRDSAAMLDRMTPGERRDLAARLAQITREIGASAVLAPAVIYDAGQRAVQRVNGSLFDAAREASQQLGVPVYGTVVLGNSVMASAETLSTAVASATALNCDGFYVACEFREPSVPATRSLVTRFLHALLTIATTGVPVMHAYAGPMSLLSFAAGSSAVALGHWKNLWQFDRSRFEETPAQGGGPTVYPPRRFFSRSLWGTIVYPDESIQLPSALRRRVLTHSPFSEPVRSGAEWLPRDAHRHLVHAIGTGVAEVAEAGSARACTVAAQGVLDVALELQDEVRKHIVPRDGSDAYQASWRASLTDLLESRGGDFDFLDLLVST